MQFWKYFNEICLLHLPSKTVFLGIYIYLGADIDAYHSSTGTFFEGGRMILQQQ